MEKHLNLQSFIFMRFNWNNTRQLAVRTIAFVLFLVVISSNANSQDRRFTSGKVSLNISSGETKPPFLELSGDVTFVDATGDRIINANETCRIILKVSNTGMGDANGLRGIITANGNTNGLTFNSTKIPTIKVGETKTVEFIINSGMNTTDGKVNFTVKIDEPNGFGSESYQIEVATKSFEAPLVQVVDYNVSGSNGPTLQRRRPFDLQILVQNTKYGDANDVEVRLEMPDNMFMLVGDDINRYEVLAAGDKKLINYQLVVNDRFEGEIIPITIRIKEKLGRYAKDKVLELKLNQQFSGRTIRIEGQETPQGTIAIGSLTSDVDKNIPFNNQKNHNRFALIIGNEDYHSFQENLGSESDVPFAVNDANVFKRYCENVLGVEERNIFLLTNATAADMKRKVVTVCDLVKAHGGNAELIFYYSGHGYPDANKEAYIIPVNVSAAFLSDAIKLNDLYNQFSNTGASKITVFLDACFSGGGRNAGLIAAKGVAVKAKPASAGGNMVVFSASSDEQRAFPYEEKQHGAFTYFLLKELQKNNGEPYGTMFETVKNEVYKTSIRMEKGRQNPEVNISPAVMGQWENWKF